MDPIGGMRMSVKGAKLLLAGMSLMYVPEDFARHDALTGNSSRYYIALPPKPTTLT